MSTRPCAIPGSPTNTASKGPVTPFGSDGDGSGCTPGQTVLPDGFWYVHDLTPDGANEPVVTFDLVCRYSDNERQLIYTPDEVDFDNSVRNDSTLLRTMPLAEDARIVTLSPSEGITWDVWGSPRDFVAAGDPWAGWAWLQVVDGTIVEIYQQFEA